MYLLYSLPLLLALKEMSNIKWFWLNKCRLQLVYLE